MAVINALDNWYEFTDFAEVTKFVHDHEFIADILIRAHLAIGVYFGWEAVARLEVVRDSESEEGQLVVWIPTDLPPAEALARLKNFDTAWWLGMLRESRGLVCMTVG